MQVYKPWREVASEIATIYKGAKVKEAELVLDAPTGPIAARLVNSKITDVRRTMINGHLTLALVTKDSRIALSARPSYEVAVEEGPGYYAAIVGNAMLTIKR